MDEPRIAGDPGVKTRPLPPLPPIRLIERALARITERLPLELWPPAPVLPPWSALEWQLAPAVAAIHGVSTLLAAVPSRGGPLDWAAFLQRQVRMTTERHERIAILLQRLDEEARRQGIALMPLKGAALCALGLYAPGERPMADLDLLVNAHDLEATAALLASLGYRDAGTTWKHRAFDPVSGRPLAEIGEHRESPIKIDVHVRIAERLPLEEHDFTPFVAPGRMAPGLNPYPTLAALLLHLLAHTAGSMVHRGVRLIQLEDIARLTKRMSDKDWGELLCAHGALRRLWWVAAPLLLAKRYRPIEMPADVLARLARDCPRLLRAVAQRRTLTDFSLSHPRIDPAPGLFWARSGREMWKYLASRVRPSREQLAQFELLARTGPWSAEPGWYAQSHVRRILRWATSRPLRTETMQPVRAALALRLTP